MMAAATGATYLFRATGSVLGISLSNVILQNSLAKNLKASGLPKKVSVDRFCARLKLHSLTIAELKFKFALYFSITDHLGDS